MNKIDTYLNEFKRIFQEIDKNYGHLDIIDIYSRSKHEMPTREDDICINIRFKEVSNA